MATPENGQEPAKLRRAKLRQQGKRLEKWDKAPEKLVSECKYCQKCRTVETVIPNLSKKTVSICNYGI